MKIGIAGGIGSGKSYVCKLLARRGIKVYDCDTAAKRLMRTSPQLRQQLCDLIGPEAYLPQPASEASAPPLYQLNKAAVARFLLASDEHAQAIDAIVHPAVFSDFDESGLQWMESGIMFESGANKRLDRVVAVTAPKELRIRRIMQRDGITREKAEEWLQRQWPQEKVRQLADYEIINDGEHDLEAQVDRLLAIITEESS